MPFVICVQRPFEFKRFICIEKFIHAHALIFTDTKKTQAKYKHNNPIRPNTVRYGTEWNKRSGKSVIIILFWYHLCCVSPSSTLWAFSSFSHVVFSIKIDIEIIISDLLRLVHKYLGSISEFLKLLCIKCTLTVYQWSSDLGRYIQLQYYIIIIIVYIVWSLLF